MTSPVFSNRARPPRCAETPAGVTAKATTQKTRAAACRGDNRGRSRHVFEDMNSAQMRADRRENLPFGVKLLIGLIVGLMAVSAAHTHRTNALQVNWEKINE